MRIAEEHRRRWMVAGLSAVIFGLLLAAAACDDSQDRRARVARNIFNANCSGCHGSIEAGEPPRTLPGVEVQPPDLRTLARRWGLPLDRERMTRYIDGRADVAAHGSRTMPVWGDRLYADWPQSDNREAARAGTIELLVEYLETVQLD